MIRALLKGTLQNLFFPPEKDHYTYFEGAKEFPFPGNKTLVKAAWAAEASMLAYARYGRKRMDHAELCANFANGGLTCKPIGNWSASGTQAVFAECKEFAFLAFRGTEVDDPKDGASDANLIPVYEADYRPAPAVHGPALKHLSFIAQLYETPCFVHLGFQLALNEVWREVHECVTSYRALHPGVEICFTGHSLGGALAVLAFSRFRDQDISLYTFGCPRVGNQAFRDRVLSNYGRGIFRFVNYNDAVAHVPLESLLYTHVPARCHRFANDGSLDLDDGSFKGDVESLRAAVFSLRISPDYSNLHDIEAPASVVDHSPARYCIRLWNLLALSRDPENLS